MRLIKKKSVLKSVRDLMAGENPSAAVSFWSKEWVDDCRIEFSRTRILLDVSMGCTDPEAIELLLEKGADVRHLLGFHGKFFLSDRGAVLGSANATNAAIGLEGKAPRNREVVSQLSVDEAKSAGLYKWFEKRFKRGRSAEEALEIARRRFRHGRIPHIIDEGEHGESILRRALSDPLIFTGVGFVFCSGVSQDDDHKRQLDAELGAFEPSDLQDSLIFEGWESEHVRAWPDAFLQYWFNEKRQCQAFAFKTLVKNPEAGRVRVRKDWRNLVGTTSEFRPGHTREKVVQADRDLALEIFKSFPDGIVFPSVRAMRDHINAHPRMSGTDF